MGYWYWQSDDQLWGPISDAEFVRLTESGQVGSGDLVWHSTWPNWQPYRTDLIGPPPVPSGGTLANASVTDPVSHLLNQHLDHIGIPRHKQNQYQYTTILNELLGSARDGKNRRFESLALADEDVFYRAVSLLRELVVACSNREADSFVGLANLERHKSIWRHRDLKKAFAEGADSHEACPPPDVFTSMTQRYLADGLHSPTLDWVLVDAIVASEIYWFGEEVKRNPSEFTGRFAWDPFARDMDEIADYNAVRGNAKKLFWVRLRRHLVRDLLVFLYVFVAPIGFAIWADVNNLYELRDALAMMVAMVAVILFARTARWLWTAMRALLGSKPKGRLEDARKLWRKMVAAYSELEGGTASNPRRVRKRLARVVKDGAGWNTNVFALLDRVIQRSARTWS